MRRSDQPTDKQTERENEAHNSRSDNIVQNTVILDNYTMVEVLTHLNYCQLAKSSLVSKRYRGLIQKNRHKLALLKVSYIGIKYVNEIFLTAYVNMFGKVLYREAYNKWVIRKHYSEQVPVESQFNEMKIKRYENKFYQLCAFADYKDTNNAGSSITTVFYANAELSHNNGPLFQHFVRLLTDQFIYIRHLDVIPQNFLSLLACAIKPNRNRLKCNLLELTLNDNTQKIFTWLKENVHCNKFRINVDNDSNEDFISSEEYDEEFLDLFMTGANCTSKIWVRNYDLCDVVIVFVQKFMNLKSGDENRLVQSIRGNVLNRSVEGMKRTFAEFIAKEEQEHTHILEFVNNNIGKKLVLTTENQVIDDDYRLLKFVINIGNF